MESEETDTAIAGRLQTAAHRRESDLYSLGIMLLDIGLWSPVVFIFQRTKCEDINGFTKTTNEDYMLEFRGQMGEVYADIVNACLESKFGTQGGDDLVIEVDGGVDHEAAARAERMAFLGRDYLTHSHWSRDFWARLLGWLVGLQPSLRLRHTCKCAGLM